FFRSRFCVFFFKIVASHSDSQIKTYISIWVIFLRENFVISATLSRPLKNSELRSLILKDLFRCVEFFLSGKRVDLQGLAFGIPMESVSSRSEIKSLFLGDTKSF